MQHIHLDSCLSTQKYLIELHGKAPGQYLISTNSQNKGIGQRTNQWICYDNTLCFSFTLKPNEVITLTALEIAVLVVNFFKEKYHIDLKLKWPNDIITITSSGEKRKCGGIVIHRSGQSDAVIGIGLNLFKNNNETFPQSFKMSAGFIFPHAVEYSKKELSYYLCQYIFQHRLSSTEIKESWKSSCVHLEEVVKIIDDQTENIGKFIGIGKNGEALLQIEGKQNSIYNGSLFFN